jgi:uncharacterized membrane protein
MQNVEAKDGKMTIGSYVYNVSAAVSNAVLVMLGVGLLFQSVANITHWTALYQVGALAQVLLPAAFGAGGGVTTASEYTGPFQFHDCGNGRC